MTALANADQRLEAAHPERWKEAARGGTIDAVRAADSDRAGLMVDAGLRLLHAARTGTGQSTLPVDVQAYERAVTGGLGALS